MKVSSPDKIIFPDVGITKADMVQHYEVVGDRMVEFLGGRPLTLQRFPRGINAKGFMQKNAGDHFPETIGRYAVPRRDGEETIYPVVDRAEDIAYLANQNTLTFHMWTSTTAQPLHPDWLVMDLDPEADDLDGVRNATMIIGDLLRSFDLHGFPIATGSKGFHVWVPLDGAAHFNQVSNVSRALGGLAALHNPEDLTTEFLKKNRHGRVFVDWLRNAQASTVVVPFSLRPRANAPVAVPLTWEELNDATPDGWTLGNIQDRLQLRSDIKPQALPVDAIVNAAEAAGVDLHTPHDRFGRKR